MTSCTLCPRECGVDRARERGFCGIGSDMMIAKVMLHRWEEPCICYGEGSGAVFFSGCQLKCVFCQNHPISYGCAGRAVSSDELSRMFLKLQGLGACNINLVSPTPHLDHVVPALRKAKESGLTIPVLYNSGGYEKTETIAALSGLIDIYMPDFKFYTEEEARSFASASNYKETAEAAIAEMVRQLGSPVWEGDKLKSGVLVRHLVLPGHTKSSEGILERLCQRFGKDGIVLSLMRQYTPMHKAKDFPCLSRKLTTLEYDRVVKRANELGFSFVITQKKESAVEDFVPDFSDFSTDFR